MSLILKNHSRNNILKSNSFIISLLSNWNPQDILNKFQIYAGYLAKRIFLASHYHCAWGMVDETVKQIKSIEWSSPLTNSPES